MKCDHCGSRKSKVIDWSKNRDYIRRRRQCSECGERFTTYEVEDIFLDEGFAHTLQPGRKANI